MRNGEMVKIDFDALAADDEAHYVNFKITVPDIFLISGFATLFVVVFLQFFTRYVFNDSIAWTEEAARYLLILLSFAGAIRCQILGTHIVLEFMDHYYGRLTESVKRFAAILSAGLFAILALASWQFIERTSFQQMVSLPFPKYYLHALVFVFVIANFAVAAFQVFRGGTTTPAK